MSAALRELVLDGVESVLPSAAKAHGGDRLGRAVRQLRQLRERVPAAAALAKCLERLADDDASALLDLLRTLRPLRGGLAAAGLAGDIEPLPESGPWSTPVPAAELARPLRWLRKPNWDDDWKATRLFLTRQSDLRLVGPLLGRLAEKSAEVAEFVAERLLPAYGPALLPELQPLLEHGERRTQTAAVLAICHIDGSLGAALCRPRLEHSEVNVRLDALRCLRLAAPDEAKRTALAWLAGTSLRAVRDAAWRCLHELRPLKARDLPALWRSQPHRDRAWAAPVVGSVGRAAVAPLAELLRSPEATLRAFAAEALGCVGEKAEPAVLALTALLDDPEEPVRETAVIALSRIGEVARRALPRLIEILDHDDSEAGIAYSAGEAMVKIGRGHPLAVAALARRLDSKNHDAVFNAVARLAELGPAAAPAVPRLIALYPRTVRVARGDVLDALAEIGPAAKPARPLLEKALKDKDVRIRFAAAVALGMLGPVGKAAVPVLIEAMRNGQWWWRTTDGERALRALASLGPAAAAAVPDLAAAARTEYNPERRRLAREALATIRGTT